jgi:tape measure domain-containing protein
MTDEILVTARADTSDLNNMSKAVEGVGQSVAGLTKRISELESVQRNATGSERRTKAFREQKQQLENYRQALQQLKDAEQGVQAQRLVQYAEYKRMLSEQARGLHGLEAQADAYANIRAEIKGYTKEVEDARNALAKMEAEGNATGMMYAKQVVYLRDAEKELADYTKMMGLADAKQAQAATSAARLGVVAENSFDRIAGSADAIKARLLATGEAFDTVKAAVDKVGLALRKNELTSQQKLWAEQIVDLQRLARALGEDEEALAENAAQILDLRDNIKALQPAVNEITSVMARLTAEQRAAAITAAELAEQERLAAEAAREQAAAERANNAAMSSRVDAMQSLVDMHLKRAEAERASIDALNVSKTATAKAEEALKIYEAAARKSGHGSRAAESALRQLNDAMRDADLGISKLGKAETRNIIAQAELRDAIAHTTLSLTAQNAAEQEAARLTAITTKRIKEEADAYAMRRAAMNARGVMAPEASLRGSRGGAPLIDAETFHRESAVYSRGLGVLNQQLGKVATTVSYMRLQLLALASVFGVFQLAHLIVELDLTHKSLVAVTTDMNAAHAAATQAAVSLQAYAEATSFLTRVSDDYEQRVKDLTRSYILLTTSTNAANIPLEQAQKAYEGIVAASKVLGKSNEDTQGSLTAISQIASKGVVSMEELRQQLGERLPGALDILATGLGVTTAQLIDDITKGKVSAQQFFAVFGDEALKRFGDAGKDINSLSGAFNLLYQSLDEIINSALMQGLADGLAEVLRAVTGLMKSGPMMQAATAFANMFKAMGDGASNAVEQIRLMGGASVAFRGLIEVMGVLGSAASALWEVITALFGVLVAVTNTLSDLGVFKAFAAVLDVIAKNADLVAVALATWGVSAVAKTLGAMIGSLEVLGAWLASIVVAARAAAVALSVMFGPVTAGVMAFVAVLGIATAAWALFGTAGVTVTQDVDKAIRDSEMALNSYKDSLTQIAVATEDRADAVRELQRAIVSMNAASIAEARTSYRNTMAQIAIEKSRSAALKTDLLLRLQSVRLAAQEQQALSAQLLLEADRARIKSSAYSRFSNPFSKNAPTAGAITAQDLANVSTYRARLEEILSLGLRQLTVNEQAFLEASKGGDEAVATYNEIKNILTSMAALPPLVGPAGMTFVSPAQQQALGIVLANYREITDTIRAAKMEQLAMASGGVSAYESVQASAAAAEDMRAALKAAAGALDDQTPGWDKAMAASEATNAYVLQLTRSLAASGNVTAQMAVDLYEAQKAASATAAAAQAIVNVLAAAVAQARSLRAQLGAGAVDLAWVKTDAALIVEEIAALKSGNAAQVEAVALKKDAVAVNREYAASTADVTRAHDAYAAGQRASAGLSLEAQKAAKAAIDADAAGMEQRVAQLTAERDVKLKIVGLEHEKAAAQEDYNKAQKTGSGGASKAAKEEAKDLAAAIKLLEKATKDAKGTTAEANQEALAIAEAQKMVNAAVAAGTITLSEYNIEMARVDERMAQLQDGYVNLADAITDSMGNAMSGISEAMVDMLASGLSKTQDFGKAVLNVVRSMLRDILSTIANNAIVVPIKAAIEAGINGTGAGLFGAIGSLIKGVSSSFASSLSSIFSGNFTQALAPVAELASGAATGLAGIGAALGALAGPLALVAGVFAALKKTTTVLATGLKVTLRDALIDVETYKKTVTSSFFGLIKKRRTSYGSAGTTGSAVEDSLVGIFASIEDAASTLGLSEAAFSSFLDATRTFSINLKGMSADEARDAVQAWLTTIGSKMVNFGTKSLGLKRALDEVALAGETSYDTFIRLATSLEVVNDTLEAMNLEGFAQSFAGAADAADLAQIFGGVEEFVAAMNNYANLFLTDAEKLSMYQITLQQRLADVNRQFPRLNAHLPRSAEELRDMVNSLDMSTESGRALAGMLIGNASLFDQWFQLMAQGSEQVQELNRQQANILQELTRRYEQMMAAEKALLEARTNLRMSDAAPGDEMSQYNAMYQDFMRTRDLALAGDAQAATDLIAKGNALLEQARLVYGNTSAYGDVFDMVDTTFGTVADAMADLAAIVDEQLDRETFTDLTEWSTARLLTALANIQAQIASASGMPLADVPAVNAAYSASVAANAPATPAVSAYGANVVPFPTPPNRAVLGTQNTTVSEQTFEELTTRMMNALLGALGSIDTGIAELTEAQEDKARALAKAALRKAAGS